MLYDGQCEICQACVSWVKTIDRHNLTVCLPISAEVLLEVDSRLRMDECLRQLHVVTPQGEIYVGWDAVTCLARRFPSTSVIGVVGQWFPFRQIGRLLYGFVARNSIHSASAGVALAAWRSRNRYEGKQTWERSGHVIQSDFFCGCRSWRGQASRLRYKERTFSPEPTTSDSICWTAS